MTINPDHSTMSVPLTILKVIDHSTKTFQPHILYSVAIRMSVPLTILKAIVRQKPFGPLFI
jgi:hypothetical protein